jgi:hypothetical protein
MPLSVEEELLYLVLNALRIVLLIGVALGPGMPPPLPPRRPTIEQIGQAERPEKP